MRKNNYFVEQTDESTNEAMPVLTENGRSELSRLETKYLPTMTVTRIEKYSSYSDVEKLKSLIAKEKRDGSKNGAGANKEKRIPLVDYIISHPVVDWLNMDLKVLERIEDVFNVYLDEIEIAKQLIFSDRIKNEISTLKQQRLDIDAKIKELENAKQDILAEAV